MLTYKTEIFLNHIIICFSWALFSLLISVETFTEQRNYLNTNFSVQIKKMWWIEKESRRGETTNWEHNENKNTETATHPTGSPEVTWHRKTNFKNKREKGKVAINAQ